MNVLSYYNRSKLKEKLQSQTFDLVVVGGGITGAGIALDAASRGLKTALVEKNDFASGTSSRSTKLIHGGLRYLKQFEIALVREVGKERATVHRLAPHLVTSEKMLLPLTEGGTYGKIATSVGLMVYDVLAGVEKADQRVMLPKDETLELEPLLNPDNLKGGGLYAEYRTDDARLTIEVIKTAATFGALSINYVNVDDFTYTNSMVSGVKCTDVLSGELLEIKAKKVVSAAGPWVDELREKNKSKQGKRLHLTKGVHIVVDHKDFPVQQSIYFDVPDGRMIFAIPRGKITYIGTTDTDYHGEKDHVRTHQEDVDYLLEAVNANFPTIHLERQHVKSNWAGLRPLIHEDGKSASELSRKDEIFESETGLISIAGGKLTGYRKMAERIVDKICDQLAGSEKKTFKKCHTDEIVLTGGVFNNATAVEDYIKEVHDELAGHGLDFETARYLVSNFGKQTDYILDNWDQITDEPDPLVRLGKAELLYTLHNEMVAQPFDFFERRTGRLYFDIDMLHKIYEPLLAGPMAETFGWSESQLQNEKETVERALYEAANFEPAAVAEKVSR